MQTILAYQSEGPNSYVTLVKERARELLSIVRNGPRIVGVDWRELGLALKRSQLNHAVSCVKPTRLINHPDISRS